MKKIVLCCAGGMSTSMLMTKMETYAKSINKEVDITAVSIESLKEIDHNIDVILLGPQIRFEVDNIKNLYNDTDTYIDVIDTLDYGTMNGEKVLKKVLDKI